MCTNHRRRAVRSCDAPIIILRCRSYGGYVKKFRLSEKKDELLRGDYERGI